MTSQMHQFLTDIKTVVIDTLFPIRCVCCYGESPRFVCEQCLLEFSDTIQQRCVECGRPALLGITHSGCRKPWAADRVVSSWNYQNPKVSKAIISGKYQFLPKVYEELGIYLSEIIAQTSEVEKLQDFILCAMPLTKQRLRWRGFNQAEILCEQLTRYMGLSSENLLIRRKTRPPQKDLDKDKRLTNILGCFSLAQGAEVRDKSILLIDDVTTTGATLREAAKVLKRNGAKQVWCLTLAQD